ncbi:hypothetical protein KC19_10G135200 [Ceratodon purpureus]|uniref:BHLH domain-containing protein n=1 Tax=Ceratodon purpureus TaxID=3225 RepID=A0A8T0GSD3_CERPU|nr:hypothetical protein KC19_10G135200 [Ceratodon purpureus]
MAFVATGKQKQVIGSSLGFSGLGDPQQRELQAVQRYAMAQQQQQQAERSQPHHFARSEDTKASTHDFLSLYGKGSQQAENGSSAGVSSSLTTHDFLQPLERNGARPTHRDSVPAPRENHNARLDNIIQSRNSTPVPSDRVLPTAMPNYTSIQVPYAVPPNSMIRMGGEPEALHRQGRGYPLATLSSREDHSGPDSMRGVEVAMDPEAANGRENLAYWPGPRFKFGLPSDLTFPGASPVVKSAVENGHQSMPAVAKQWAQAAQGMIEVPKQAARPPSEDEDDDEDSSERPKGDRKEPMSHKGDAAQRMDAKNPEMRGGTPRSKHSATEQRRRSKINDRFQMLRDLVPHSDQKRDKASFLLEVIDYIQALQDKVRKFENAEQIRHQERLKSMVWDLCKRGATGSGDETSQVNALVFAKDLSSGGGPVDIKPVPEVNADIRAPRPSEQAAPISEAHSTGGLDAQQGPSRPACSIHSCVSSLDGEKENAAALTAQPLAMGMSLRHTIPLPYALPIVPSKLQRDQDYSRGTPALEHGYARAATPDHQFEVRPRFSSATQADQTSGQQSKADRQISAATFIGRIDGAQAGLPFNASASRQLHGAPQFQENVSKHARHPQFHQNDHSAPADGSAASPSPAQSFPRIQGGAINVSSVYSQGLLDTLTRALQSSGVDLSQANISVQIELGKNAAVAAADTSAKVATTPESSAQSHQSQGRTRPSPMAAEPEPSLKRPKLETHE